MTNTPPTVQHVQCECGEPLGSVRGNEFRAGGMILPRTITGRCARCGAFQRWSPSERVGQQQTDDRRLDGPLG